MSIRLHDPTRRDRPRGGLRAAVLVIIILVFATFMTPEQVAAASVLLTAATAAISRPTAERL